MPTIEKIKSDLIGKISLIEDKDFLQAIDVLISSNTAQTPFQKLSLEQKVMMEMSEADINEGRLISQEALEKRNLEWLEGK
ncbi:hypothetical protein [Mongoliitalea lutea]|jgi:hypothetical protein|uniref:Addiction module component n=1 Tax=Mongoliitalea lutea TaxID=849756 RepID=A0A8J3G5S1_9BACT|nr:hypothetical protein [Mongoliitalea lutea]GHB39693.1 hypothetical protein GCM10008106_21010 [Mongoliitalea lutea]